MCVKVRRDICELQEEPLTLCAKALKLYMLYEQHRKLLWCLCRPETGKMVRYACIRGLDDSEPSEKSKGKCFFKTAWIYIFVATLRE